MKNLHEDAKNITFRVIPPSQPEKAFHCLLAKSWFQHLSGNTADYGIWRVIPRRNNTSRPNNTSAPYMCTRQDRYGVAKPDIVFDGNGPRHILVFAPAM